MDTFIKNDAGIHVSGESYKIDYPDIGHQDSLSFEEESFWFRHRNHVIAEVIKKTTLTTNFVDIGGGNGLQAVYIQKQFPEKEVAMVEPGYTGCLSAKRRGLKHIYNCLFQAFDFKAFHTSMVGLFDVVEHIEDDAAFLGELSQKLQPGSIILITVPAYNWLWSDLDDYGSHYRRYDHKMIKELARKCGFKINYFSYFFSYLIPLTYLLRTLPFKLRGSRTKEEMLTAENNQHKPNPFINKLFSFLGSIELSFIKKSSCKFGASIIVAFEIP